MKPQGDLQIKQQLLWTFDVSAVRYGNQNFDWCDDKHQEILFVQTVASSLDVLLSCSCVLKVRCFLAISFHNLRHLSQLSQDDKEQRATEDFCSLTSNILFYTLSIVDIPTVNAVSRFGQIIYSLRTWQKKFSDKFDFVWFNWLKSPVGLSVSYKAGGPRW